ncbi:hypothetical protein ACFQ0Q_32345 [Streptomyces aureus]
MYHYKMTESFAGAMVTVIPIIMLVAGVEAAKAAKAATRSIEQMVQHALAQTAAGERRAPVISPWQWVLLVAWAAVGLAHVFAETLLITWLGKTERPTAPGQALFITLVAVVGFFSVAMGPVFVMTFKVAGSSLTAMRHARDALRDLQGETTHESAQTGASPDSGTPSASHHELRGVNRPDQG